MMWHAGFSRTALQPLYCAIGQHRHQPSSPVIVICSEGCATLIRRMTCCRPCVRTHAADYGVNPEQVGAMGFSAGGHLVMSGAELFSVADRPAFVAPVYPVVTFTQDFTHKRSRRALLGDGRKHSRVLCDSLSLECHVPADCPPVFLVNCKDDPVVDYRNSELLDSALTARHVAHRYIQYETGGHGFGASDKKGTAESRQWRASFLDWLHEICPKDLRLVSKNN